MFDLAITDGANNKNVTVNITKYHVLKVEVATIITRSKHLSCNRLFNQIFSGPSDIWYFLRSFFLKRVAV